MNKQTEALKMAIEALNQYPLSQPQIVTALEYCIELLENYEVVDTLDGVRYEE